MIVILEYFCLAVFRNKPPSPPSQAQMLAANVLSDEDYCSSLRNIFANPSFTLLLITYGKKCLIGVKVIF